MRRSVATGRRGILLSAVLFVMLSGCATQGEIRSFLLEDGRQYFVRPVRLTGESGSVLMDFTVRLTEVEGETRRSASANFSLPMGDGSREIDAASFQLLEGSALPLEEIRFLFIGDGFIRYESTMAYEALARLAEAAAQEDRLVTFQVRRGGSVREYRPRGEFYEAMAKLHLRLE